MDLHSVLLDQRGVIKQWARDLQVRTNSFSFNYDDKDVFNQLRKMNVY